MELWILGVISFIFGVFFLISGLLDIKCLTEPGAYLWIFYKQLLFEKSFGNENYRTDYIYCGILFCILGLGIIIFDVIFQ